MLDEPVPFTPAVTTTATRGRLFVIAGQHLCVREPRPTVPVGDAGDALYLGDLDGKPCFARLIDDGPPPADSEPTPLRQLFGALTDDEFAVAGRALGLTAWDRDHRWCRPSCRSPAR